MLLTLPQPAEESRQSRLTRSLSARNAKILIVDDEPINLQVVRKHLMLGGYERFVLSTDSSEVLALLERENPDLLLLDIMMPGVSGLQVLQAARASARYAHLPVLILTAVDDREIKTEALNLGATDFLAKPIDP